jgi:hypothetical protein
MTFEFWPQCCDAQGYLQYGAECAANGTFWNLLRPIGIVYYMSLPMRLGYPNNYVVALNLLMILLSIVFSSLAMGALFPETTRSKIAVTARWIAITFVYYLFAYPDAHVALSDIPAACTAILGICLFILGCEKKHRWMIAFSGLFFGLAAILRVAYLHPAYLMLFSCALISIRHSLLTRKTMLAFALLMGIPLLLQYGLTYRHTGYWSFIAPSETGRMLQLHLTTTYYGSETLVNAGGFDAYFYNASDVFKAGGGGYLGAWNAHDYMGIFLYFLKHQIFYFAGFGNLTYIAQPSDRVFSVWFLILNIGACMATWQAFLGRGRVKTSSLALAYILAVWGLASLIMPDRRFVVMIHLLTWIVGLSMLVSWTTLKFFSNADKTPGIAQG